MFLSKFIHSSYTSVLKPIFFLFCPENIHDRLTQSGQFLGKYPLTRGVTAFFFKYQNEILAQEIAGIHFSNPIGLAAGFDKNGLLLDILPSVGFGFAEIGSITGKPCSGNPKPRLWRLPKTKSLVVNFGLKNDGAEAIAKRLKNYPSAVFPFGISVAKTNDASTVKEEAGIADYLKVVQEFKGIGSYYTINLSCPNAYGGQPFCDQAPLEKLLHKLDPSNLDKPVFLKLSPDLTSKTIDATIALALKYKVKGLICSNLTKTRPNPEIKDSFIPESGSFSGKLVAPLALEQIKYSYQQSRGKLIIVGCGGVFNAQDAYRMIRQGASLIQLITGMIFEGPQLIGEINQDLVRLLKKDGFNSLKQAIGIDNPF
jgi:dihydroorotate dehydrogenase